MNELLNEYIKKSGYKLGYIASQLGITYVALHNKLCKKHEFTLNEAMKLKNLLNISDEDWNQIVEDITNETVSASN